MITLRKLSVLPHIIILDSATSCVPTSTIETIHSEVPFERKQLASSTGEDISDQVYIMHNPVSFHPLNYIMVLYFIEYTDRSGRHCCLCVHSRNVLKATEWLIFP